MSNTSHYKVLRYLKQKYPVHVQIDISGICHHRCEYCFFHEDAMNIGVKRDDIRQQKFMDTDLAISLLRQLKEAGTQAITFPGGGEPLLHPEYERIFRTASDLGLRWGLISNLDRKNLPLDLFSQAAWVRVSLDAGSQEMYQRVHQPSTRSAWQTVVNNIGELAKVAPVGISYLVYPPNASDLGNGIKLAHDLGCSYIQIKPVHDITREDIPQMAEKVNQAVAEVQQKYGSNAFGIYNQFSDRLGYIYHSRRNYQECRLIRYRCDIGVDGNVYPCCFLEYVAGWQYGNIAEKTFKQIWDEDRPRVAARIDVNRCPNCHYNEHNELLEYLEKADDPFI